MSQPTPPPGRQLNLRGAVDLSGLKRPATPPGGAPAAGAPGASRVVVDVNEQSFGGLVQLSSQVPVVVDLRSDRSPASAQLSPVLEAIAVELAGRFLLARVDADTNPQIAAAFQAQSLPTVVAIVKGQPVPLFEGAYPAEQVRQIIDQLLQLAAQSGVTGTVPGVDGEEDAEGDAEPAEPPLPPLHAAAYEAIENDDLEGAEAAYRQALAENPADDMAVAGLAQVGLMQRTAGADLAAARAAAAADPKDVDAHLLVADLDLSGGHVEDAFSRLVDLVRVTFGPDRERVRTRLVELFGLVGTDDPRVATARRALASALF